MDTSGKNTGLRTLMRIKMLFENERTALEAVGMIEIAMTSRAKFYADAATTSMTG